MNFGGFRAGRKLWYLQMADSAYQYRYTLVEILSVARLCLETEAAKAVMANIAISRGPRSLPKCLLYCRWNSISCQSVLITQSWIGASAQHNRFQKIKMDFFCGNKSGKGNALGSMEQQMLDVFLHNLPASKSEWILSGCHKTSRHTFPTQIRMNTE